MNIVKYSYLYYNMYILSVSDCSAPFLLFSLLNNYLIFNFVTAYIPYLSSENTRVLDLFHKEFTGRPSDIGAQIIRQRSVDPTVHLTVMQIPWVDNLTDFTHTDQ